MSDPFAAFRKKRALLETAGNAGNSAETARLFNYLPCSPSADGRGEQGEQSRSRCPPADGSIKHGVPPAVDLEDWLAFYDERAAIREDTVGEFAMRRGRQSATFGLGQGDGC
jgi:hypothetical protein